MPDFLGFVFLSLVWSLIGLYVMYWVVRLGVRHGIRDTRDDRVAG